jgi:hypothetical protein
MQKQNAQFEIQTPAIVFLALKMFTWLSLLISALVIYGGDNFIYSFKHAFVNWDAIWYLKIAAEGYDVPRKCVFFPLLPLLVKIASLLIRDFAWTGILLSNIFSFFGVLFFYNLVKDSHGQKPAVIALVLFLAAPTALFYANFYSEPLFFMLSVMVFYFARKKQWLAAAITAGLASATRNYGVMLAIPLLWEFFREGKKGRLQVIKAAGLFILAVSGLVIYSVYLQIVYNDPLYFINAQELWLGRNKLVMPFTAFFTRLSDLPGLFRLHTDPMKTNLNVLYLSAAIGMCFYGFNKIKRAEQVYLSIFVIFLSLQNLMLGFSRYISAIFVLWLAAALFVSNRRSSWLWAFCSTVCFLIWQAVINFRWMAGLWVG